MAKVQVATRCTRPLMWRSSSKGARGYSQDSIAQWTLPLCALARLVDGASEVHMMVLARFMREEGRDFWQWGPGEDGGTNVDAYSALRSKSTSGAQT